MGLRTILGLKKAKKHAAEKMVKVGNYSLLADHEHRIQLHLEQFKYYSRNFSRIAKYIESKYPSYQIIDVGANIGDTVALLRTENVQQFVHLIEGDPVFVAFLEKNLPLFTNVKAYETFLGEESMEQTIEVDNTKGTAKLNVGSGTQKMAIVKLDDLVKQNQIENIKLLKTDTDGFDFKVLRGSFETIKRDKPVLFFEYDSVFLKEQNEDGLAIFEDFANLGYKTALYYDNYGKFVISTAIDNKALIAQLYAYINKKEGAYLYYDVCLFHQDDEDLAQACIQKEMEFYN